MVLTHDATCFIDYFAAGPPACCAAAPNWHYTHITDDVLPALLQATGVTEEQIEHDAGGQPGALLHSGQGRCVMKDRSDWGGIRST